MKNMYWLYAVLLGTTVLFVAVSVLIYFFGARPNLIRKKLRYGGLIISLNALISGCYTASNAEEAGCYKVADPNEKDGYVGEKLPTDSDSDSNHSTIIDTEISCYDMVEPETETPATFPIETDSDISCYDIEIETDIACYDTVYFPTDSDSDTPDSDTLETDSDSEMLFDAGLNQNIDAGESRDTEAGDAGLDAGEKDEE